MDLYDLAKDASWLEWSALMLVVIVLTLVLAYLGHLLQGITSKVCPFCMGRIHLKAIVCRFYGKDLPK
jgi:hypothetical protein